MALKDLGELFESFEHEAFRLETLSDYSGSGNVDSYQRFLAGDARPDDYNAEWVSELRSLTGEGRRVYRVHILARPLTSYLSYELGWGYRTNMTGGEEFFILDVTDGPNPLADVGDFWLFDEEFPVIMRYDDAGVVTDRESLAADRAREFVAYRDTALALAEPFPDWWRRHGDE